MKLILSVLCIWLAFGGRARADEPSSPTEADCGPTPQSDEARRALAAYWFEQGRAQVDHEAFSDAEHSFGCSLAIIQHPSTLYNLARAAEWAGDFEVALHALREYLEQNPDADNRAEAETLVVHIAGEIELRDHPPASPPLVPPAGNQGASAQDVTGWIAVALAGAGAAAGVTLGAFAGVEQQRIDDTPDGVPYSVIAGHEANRHDDLLGMAISFGAAGAFALTGILLLVLDDGDAALPVNVTPVASPESVGLAVVGRF